MSVHEAISEHSRKQHMHLAAFQEMDERRERAIASAVEQYLRGEPYSLDSINSITAQINTHAKHGISPTRQYVTAEMLETYAERLRT
ncbi:DUF2533 family protein [Paenibacillus thermotolerans]|uniref:DUF2533 family protein n=1 Tax=Paenibacillus thermotolerans TaxID=3027807 RepID=UPI002368BCFB|nr:MULTISPECIES: DUF2533 family protein [unclassified Paenibacillus]